jgi:hypothetical protein
MFYDGPKRPPVIFDDFFVYLEIPVIETSTSFLEFLKVLPSSDPFAGPRSVVFPPPSNPNLRKENLILLRAYFSTLSVFQYSASLLNVIVNETLVSYHYPPFPHTTVTNNGPSIRSNYPNSQFWGDVLSKMDIGGAVSYDVEPFDPSLFNHSNTPSAYPPDRSRALFPTNIYFAWSSSSKDADVAAAILQSTNTIRSAAIAEGQNIVDVAPYGNYALFGTPVETLYGANLPRLKSIRSKVDPNNVMALAGGFKF